MRTTLQLCLLVLGLMTCVAAHADVMVIDGYYQGKDLYVKNPTGPKGVGFCVYEVQVNGEVTSDEIYSSAFIIDLHHLGMSVGDAMTVEILYHDECHPKVLNAEAVLPESTYEVVDIRLLEDGTIEWSTKAEMGELPYHIQQFKWNKWVDVGEVPGSGRMEENRYAYRVDLHSGVNTIRVYQRTNRGKMRPSAAVTVSSDTPEITLLNKKFKDKLEFSGETHFEVYDVYGRLVKRGYDSAVDISDLDKEMHYLNFDQTFGLSFQK